jgi:SAM-dependent methyltransferase
MRQYDAVATKYRQWVAPKYQPIAELVASRATPPDGATVVEVAAGTGALTRLLAPKVVGSGRYVATDISAGMLSMARDEVDAAVDLVLADARRLPFGAGVADLVVSSLGPIQETEECFAEAGRLLRARGRLVLSMWGWGYKEALLLQEVRTALDLGDYPATPIEDATRRAEAAGLVDIATEQVQLSVSHPSVDAYLSFRGAFGCPAWLPPERYDEVLATLREFVAPYVDGSGTVNLDWTIVLLSAIRPSSLS